jgi:hypothetical protein
MNVKSEIENRTEKSIKIKLEMKIKRGNENADGE